MQINIYIAVGLCLLLGLAAGRIMKYVKLPNVTGYLIMGLIAGPYVLNIIPLEMIESMAIVPEVALGFIALSIGAEFKMSYLKQVGKAPVIIALFEALGAVLCVDTVLIACGFDVPFSLCLGAIAAATAPAATLMVVRQYKADGPVTRTLLPVVAIDDAVALIAFGVSVALAKSIQDPSSSSLLSSLAGPVIEIFGSFALGFVLGIAFAWLTKQFKSRDNRLSISFAMVFTALGLSAVFHLSSLLTIMAMSAVFVNLSDAYEKVFEGVDRITAPLFMLFFFLSGAELNITILSQVGVIGMIYVLVRVVGKVGGAALGAKLSHAEPVVQKYLGYTLIPQAGVAIGLAATAMSVVPEFGSQIRTIILCGTVIYELVGPVITRTALRKANEIK